MRRPRLHAFGRSLGYIAATAVAGCVLSAAAADDIYCGTQENPIVQHVRSSYVADRVVRLSNRCPNGHFKIFWAGKFTLNETLHVRVNSTVNITGTDEQAEISGGGKVRLFTVGAGATLHLQGLIMRDGYHEFNNSEGRNASQRIDGGAVVKAFSGSNLTVEECRFYANKVLGLNATLGGASGGAIFATAASVSVRRSIFEGNAVPANSPNLTAANYTGADYNAAYSATAFYIDQNVGIPCYGGAIFATDGSSLNVKATTFIRNIATNGAAIACTYKTSFQIESSNFTGQIGRPYRGGGSPGLGSSKGAGVYVHQPGPQSTIEGSHFIANLAAFGASVYFTQRTDESGDAIPGLGNTAYYQGCPTNLTGAISDAGSSRLDISKSVFRDNVATGNTYSNSGGILMERGVVELRANDCTFVNNSAPSSGAVQLQADSPCYDKEKNRPFEKATAMFTDCAFSENSATGDGGGGPGGAVMGVWAAFGHVEFRNCSLQNNVADRDGAGGAAKFGCPDTMISYADFSVEAHDTVFSDNHAGADGGALFISAPKFMFSFSNTLFNNNTAGRKAGAIYSGQNASITLVNSTLQYNTAGTSGGAIALEPLTANATLRGKNATFAHNEAVFSGGAVHCDHVDMFEPDDWTFIDNLSPLGQIVLLWSTVNATLVGMYQNTNSTSQEAATSAAGILAASSMLRCVECAFVGFTGSLSVIALSGGNSSTHLDSCRFVEANVSMLVASADGKGDKRLRVRNAELGTLSYVRAGYDPKFADDGINLGNCDWPHHGGCEDQCMLSDFGVFCRSFYDVLDYDKNNSWRTTSEDVTAAFYDASDESRKESSFIVNGRDRRPQFTINVTAPSTFSSPRERSYWSLDETGQRSFYQWNIQPSMGILRAEKSVAVNVSAGVPDLLILDGNTTDSNFMLYNITGEPLTDGRQHLPISSTYYYCEAGQYADPSGGDDTCKSCTIDLQGDPRGVNCSTTHGESLESLLLSKGYWRQNISSPEILKCYNHDACAGGSTPDEYCNAGYTGPYCAACEQNYASTGLAYKCIDCTQHQRSAIITILSFFAAIFILFVVAILSADNPVQCVPLGSVLGYVASSGSYIAGLWGKIPFSKLRIPLITLQILTQYSLVCNVQYPSFFEAFIRAMSFINLDFTIGVSAACLWPSANYYARLLIITLTPLLLVLVGGCFMWWWRQRRMRRMRLARRRIGGRPSASAAAAATAAAASSSCTSERRTRQEEPKPDTMSLWSCLVTVAIPVSFLVYSACSTAIFAAFQCDSHAVYHEEYLRADYSIKCEGTTYNMFRIYASTMAAVYPVGTPILFAWQLRQRSSSRRAGAPVRSVSDSGVEPAFGGEPVAPSRRSTSIVRSGPARAKQLYTEFLWKPYRTKRYYYEVVECFRRLLMTGVLVFLSAATRPIFGTLFAAASLVVYCGLKPFQDADDSQSYLTGLGAVWLQAFLSLTISAELVDSDGSSASVAASCIITLVVLSWVMVIWQAVLAARGSVAVVSESLHPLWSSSHHRTPSFFTSTTESEEETKAPKDASRRSRKDANDSERAAPAWSSL